MAAHPAALSFTRPSNTSKQVSENNDENSRVNSNGTAGNAALDANKGPGAGGIDASYLTSPDHQQIKFSRGGLVRRRAPAPKSSNINASGNSDDENTPETPEDWWQKKASAMREFFRCNPLNLGISEETVAFVKYLLKRGDRAVSFSESECLSIRTKCWRHAVLEVRGVPGIFPECTTLDDIPAAAEKAELNAIMVACGPGGDRTVESLECADEAELRVEVVRLDGEVRMRRREILELKARATEMETACSNANQRIDELETSLEASKAEASAAKEAAQIAIAEAEAAKATAPVAALPSPVRGSGVKAVKALSNSSDASASPAVRISSMSMMERQAYWMKQRKEKREQQERAKREAEDAEAARFKEKKAQEKRRRSSKWEHVRSRISEIASEGKGAGNGSRAAQDSKTQPTKPAPRKSGTSKRKSNIRRKKAAAASSAKPSLLDMCQDLLKNRPDPGKKAQDVGMGTGQAPPNIPSAAAVVAAAEEDAELCAAAAQADEVKYIPSAPHTPSPHPTPKATGFAFDAVGTSKEKGKFTIRDSSDFAIDSMYRKRDTRSTEPGVSLLLGRPEGGGAEQAIAIFFDRSKFTEEKAARWWLSNKCRFPGASPQV